MLPIGRRTFHEDRVVEIAVAVTGDQRMADVVARAGRIKKTTAKSLGLLDVAESLGLTWERQVYPRVLNLQTATDADLKEAFGGWPLPTTKIADTSRSELTEDEKQQLLNSWLEVATEYKMTNPDNLPYSGELEDIKVRFACESSKYLSNDEIFRYLIQQRKRRALPYPT